MLILGIETSCDETAAAVVRHDGEVLSDVVHSQIAVHEPFGGVVPELASRNHLTNLRPVLTQALSDADLGLNQIDAIAVTCRPGLSGALLVGIEVAKGLAWSLQVPVVGVDHLFGHLMAAFLRFPNSPPSSPPSLPFVALLASGGHTAIYRVDGLSTRQVLELGATRDDAAGEAFDKVAKLLGLGYPGGPIIDRLAASGDGSVIALSRPMPQRNTLDFSFSGLKTNVRRWVEQHGRPSDDQRLRDLCAAFQSRVVEVLTKKTIHAALREGVSTIVVGGGVAANHGLRGALGTATAAAGLRLLVPEMRACTDNAAMIGFAGALGLLAEPGDQTAVTMSPHTLLSTVTRKGRGRRGEPTRPRTAPKHNRARTRPED